MPETDEPLNGDEEEEESEEHVARYDGRAHLHDMHPEWEDSSQATPSWVGPPPGAHAPDGVNRLPELFSLLEPDTLEKMHEDYLVDAVEGARIRRTLENQSQVANVSFFPPDSVHDRGAASVEARTVTLIFRRK